MAEDSSSEHGTMGIDRQNWRHCYECGARADVIRYDTFYKLVECRECGEETLIPKKCASAFDEFQEFVEEAADA